MKIDPRTLSEEEIDREVESAMRGSQTASEAEQRIKERFFPEPLVMVQERGDHFAALVLVFTGTESREIVCPR